MLLQVFQILDVHKDGILTWPELHVAQINALVTIFPFLEPLPQNFSEIRTQEDTEPTDASHSPNEATEDVSKVKEEL